MICKLKSNLISVQAEPSWTSLIIGAYKKMKFIAVTTLSLLLFASVAVAEADKRQTLNLSEEQRVHVREEMRTLLLGIRNILTALTTDDMVAVTQFSRPLGMGMVHKSEEHLESVLPKAFMQLGLSVHQDFDQIASDAESKKNPKLTLRQLSNTMNKCVTCHDAYQIHTAIASPEHGEPTGHHQH